MHSDYSIKRELLSFLRQHKIAFSNRTGSLYVKQVPVSLFEGYVRLGNSTISLCFWYESPTHFHAQVLLFLKWERCHDAKNEAVHDRVLHDPEQWEPEQKEFRVDLSSEFPQTIHIKKQKFHLTY